MTMHINMQQWLKYLFTAVKIKTVWGTFGITGCTRTVLALMGYCNRYNILFDLIKALIVLV